MIIHFRLVTIRYHHPSNSARISIYKEVSIDFKQRERGARRSVSNKMAWLCQFFFFFKGVDKTKLEAIHEVRGQHSWRFQSLNSYPAYDVFDNKTRNGTLGESERCESFTLQESGNPSFGPSAGSSSFPMGILRPSTLLMHSPQN